MPADSLNDCRKQFEIWLYGANPSPTDRHALESSGDGYRLMQTQHSCMAWRAAWEFRDEKIEDMENAMMAMSDSLGVLAND